VVRANTCSSSFWTRIKLRSGLILVLQVVLARIELRSGLILVLQVFGRGLNRGPGLYLFVMFMYDVCIFIL